jgi:PAS domain S-box-containing protein
LTHSPPSSAADLTALSREQALAALPHDAPQDWVNDKARLAILAPPGVLTSASPDMLALFGAKDCEALEARLVRGEGPSARRLRHLAATLPLGAPPRLEQMRVVVDRRPTGVNLRCVRMEGPGGANWLLVSVPALGAANDELPAGDHEVAQTENEASQSEDSAPSDLAASPPPNSRFLWTLDGEGRFGEPHPMVVAAVRANAPRPGESVEALLHRVGLDGGDELIRVLGERQTFSGVKVEWPLPGVHRRRVIALSAAPLFGRQREFLGYRGFGVVGEEIEAAATPEGRVSTEAGEDNRSAPLEMLEPGRAPLADDPQPEVKVSETAAEPVEPKLEFQPTDGSGAPLIEAAFKADGDESTLALSDPFEPSRLSSAGDIEAESEAYESAAELIQPYFQLSPTDDLDAPPEGLLDGGAAAAVTATDIPPPAGFAPEAQAHENGPEPTETNLESALPGAADEPPLELSVGTDGPKSALAPPETGDAEGPGAEVDQPDLAERPAASEAQPAPPERTAAIYVLRHPAPLAPSNIVPIRPGALDALARESAQSSPAESVELSRSERDAFREIARALVGRTPASRDDQSEERTGSEVIGKLGIEARAEQPKDRQGEFATARGDEQVQRNAGAVLDRLPVGVLIARDGGALYANRTLLELIGYRDFADFQAANGLSRMFRDRDPPGMTAEDAGAVAIVRADGQILSVDGHAQVIGWDGAPATLIALRRSLDAELRARMRAAETQGAARGGLASGELQAMLDRASDGAVTLDSAGRIVLLNEPAERLFGYRQNEIAGESVLMLLSPQSHPETTARLESLSHGGESEAAFRPLQVFGRDRNGASIPLSLTLARIGPSEAPQFCALVRDLSRERETERRLIGAREAAEAASTAKTDFLAQVSHEIRTPLHAILGFAEVMLEERFGPVGNERYKDYLKDIHASGNHVMSLADDLLDLSKIEAGKLELAFASVDANSVIRECVSLMQPQAARERVIMRVSLHDRLPRVMVDERSLKQIMLNLMSNAVKFNEPGGQVIVSTAVDAAGQAVIRVRDTGVGMNENEVGLALAPFSQVGRGGAKGGAGLGLPLTKALVEANKAEFSIKSRREQGTLIEIAFPNIQAAQ